MAGKWVEAVAMEAPAAEVAARILRQRLESVEESLPLAALKYDKDVEHVHRLRVACRRAGAALSAFRPLLAEKPKSLQKWLRRIRRAAGPARDTDVLLLRLKKEQRSGHEADYVIARLREQRKADQVALVDLHEKVTSGKFDKSVQRGIAAFQQEASGQAEPFSQFAKKALRSASSGVFEHAGIVQPTVPQLHGLRIAGKRLRYSIEIFHSAFAKDLRRKIYPTMEKIQARLGKLNDHATAQALFLSWLRDLPADDRAAYLARLIVEEHEAALRIREEFLQWWKPKRIAKLESQLASLIGAGR